MTINTTHISPMMLREEAPGTFRVQCLECFGQFDLFGDLKAGDVSPEYGPDRIVQQCIEHAKRCTERSKPERVHILRNRNSPNIYKLTISWGRVTKIVEAPVRRKA